jgi:hypothetical protein
MVVEEIAMGLRFGVNLKLPIAVSLIIITISIGLMLLRVETISATFPGANGKIAFVSDRDGNQEIYVMNPDGSGVTRLTNNAAHDVYPAWSPDGSKIAFTSNRDGNWEIYVMNADGSGATRLTDNGAADFAFDWQPIPSAPQPSVVWVEVYDTGSNLAIRKTPGDGELLKCVPDGWVLKLIDTHGNSIVKDGHTWWEVEDVTDGIVGWAASTYLRTNDQERLKDNVKRVDDINLRKVLILEAVAHYYHNKDTISSLYSSDDKGNKLSILKENNFPIELILAIIAQESGGVSFDNEFISSSNGYGIMQITGVRNMGYGNKLKCYATNCKYYTNTKQGIYANIKDGLRVLQWAYQTALEDKKIEDAVWRYNHGGNDRKGDPYYLKNVAEKLKNLKRYFGEDYKNFLGDAKILSPEELDNLYNMLMTYQQIKLESPGELRVYDSQHRVTGLVNGEVRIEIPNSDYYEGNIIIFSPADSYRYIVAATNEGTYGLVASSVTGQEIITFNATDIPISANATHQYTIDWTTLSRGEGGVTVQVDSNSDGVFERTFASDSELSQDEFVLAALKFYGVWEGINYPVFISSNSTISNFTFNQSQKQISFNVIGSSGTKGYCNVTIPKSLLKGEPWTVTVDGAPISFIQTENATYSFLYFTYKLGSTIHVTIQGTWVTPEFSSTILLPLFTSTILIATILLKKKRS